MNIFLVEDDEVDRLLIQACLNKSKDKVNLYHAKTLKEANELLSTTNIKWDCALLDYTLTDGTCLNLYGNEKLKDIPCIILTGHTDEDLSIQALKAGFEDYLSKATLNTHILIKSIKYAIERNKIKQKLYETQKKLEGITKIDPLTELLNRRGLTEVLTRLKNREETHGIILIDVDKFKTINDKYGYVSGDKALKLVADVLRTTARPLDQIARIGGDEFIVLVQNVDLKQCLTISERIRASVEASSFIVDDNKTELTVSIGVALLNNSKTVEDLLKATQEALKRSKAGGRNVVYI